MVGANHPRISVNDLLDLRLPIPPLDSQRDLAAQLRDIETEISSATTRIADLRRDLAITVGGLWR